MTQPHAVIALPNNIEIDARAHRNGLALLAAGYRVTMVGYGTGLPNRGEIAGIPYFLCQAKPKPGSPAAAAAKAKPPLLSRVVRKGFQVAFKRRPPQQIAKAVALVEETAASAAKKANATVITPARDLASRARHKAEEVASTPQPVDPNAPVDWRKALPIVPTMIEAMAGTVGRLDPDVIITDVHLLPLGVKIAELQAAKGKKMGLVYDAREYVYGLASDDTNITKGFPALEAEFMDRVDATVTVCEPIADFLQRKYDLPVTPPLVPNAPIGNLPDAGRSMTIRDFLDVGDAPLLVYAGGLSYHRGVHDVVVALADLPGVHLALGARRGSSYTQELEQIAKDHGVSDRLHFVPFAPTHEVAEYLSSATAAIFPFLPVGNHVWAAPNKYFESVQARLPILTSNMEWLSDRVTRLGIGEVFDHSNPASIVRQTKKLLGNLEQYRSRITPELIAEHTFEHFEKTVQDVTMAVTTPELLAGLEPSELTSHLTEIRRDMLSRRAGLADSDIFAKRPWLRIGCTNTGGQPKLWAGALMRQHPEAIAESVWLHRDQPYTFPVDETITYHQWISPAWQKQLAAKLDDRVTHVLTESARPVVGAKHGKFFYDEIDFFKNAGIRQGLVFHGSDIRNPRWHASAEPDSPFADPDDELTSVLQKQVDDLTPHVLAFEGPKFVTTNDLIDYVPDATWLPVVVDTVVWANEEQPMSHAGLPVVFHTPSKRSLKGSDVVDQIAKDLEAEGRIRYVGRSKLSREEMRAEMLAADIVIDQLKLGDYGITAVEAMSGGRVVIGHVASRVRERIDGDVPIVEASAETLREVLLDLIGRPQRAAELADAGRAYAKRWHDGTHSASVLADFMGL